MSADPNTSSSNLDPKPAPPKATTPSAGDAKSPASGAAGAPASANELTPEEQMERFEKELKETDWGHQPC
ncbi:MAG TPA: hypothetical protein VMM36_10935 [Opitutaceae bacterium]|nr:hypothetical protein [Opitutaceae bacterium]